VKEKDLYLRVIKKFGVSHQIQKLTEECGELISASARLLNNEGNKILSNNFFEEMADVLILIEQMECQFPNGISQWKKVKIARLEGLVNGKE
jgi:NTP pyrophosphatase (non-canonical NTP hydrolase)